MSNQSTINRFLHISLNNNSMGKISYFPTVEQSSSDRKFAQGGIVRATRFREMYCWISVTIWLGEPVRIAYIEFWSVLYNIIGLDEN